MNNTRAPKKPASIKANSNVLEKSKKLNTNLSATLEDTLDEQVRADRHDQWKRENAKAIQAYNRFVEDNGAFSDGLRKF
jgi:antitoxin CcdA